MAVHNSSIIIKILSYSWVQVALVVVVTGLAYSNIFENQWFDDDYDFILNWTLTRDWQSLPALLAGSLPDKHEGLYRPLRSVWYLLVYQAFGLKIWWYHALSLVTHLGGSVLIYGITRRLSARPMIALVTALLFGLHPIHVDAVTFITSSFDMIGVFFFLGAFYLYVTYRQWPKQKLAGKRGIYLASVLGAMLAYFSYEMTLVLPAILVLYELTLAPAKTASHLKAFLGLPWKSLIPFGLGVVGYSWIRWGILAIGARGTYPGDSFFFTLLLSIKAMLKYLQLTIIPYPLTIAHTVPTQIYVYTLPRFNQAAITTQSLLEPMIWLSLIIYLGLIILAVKVRRTYPLCSFAIGWFLLTMLVFTNLIPSSCVVCERYLYASSFSACLVGGWSLYGLWSLKKIMLGRFALPRFFFRLLTLMLASGWMVWFGYRTYARNQDWQDTVTIWQATTRQSPQNSGVWYKLGVAYQNNRQFEDAIQAYQHTLALTPEFFLAHYNLGILYEAQGELVLAGKHYRQAITLEPAYPDAQASLGAYYQRQGDMTQAIERYQHALILKPGLSLARDNLTFLLSQQASELLENDQPLLAAQTYAKLLDYVSATPSILTNLGSIYAQMQDYVQAQQYYRQALELDPNYTQARENLEKVKNVDLYLMK